LFIQLEEGILVRSWNLWSSE